MGGAYSLSVAWAMIGPWLGSTWAFASSGAQTRPVDAAYALGGVVAVIVVICGLFGGTGKKE